MSSPHDSTTPIQDSDQSQYNRYPLSDTSVDCPIPASSLYNHTSSGVSLSQIPPNDAITKCGSAENVDGSFIDFDGMSQPTAQSAELDDEIPLSEEAMKWWRQQQKERDLKSQMKLEGAVSDDEEIILTDPSRSEILRNRSERSHRIGSMISKSGISKRYQRASRQPGSGHGPRTDSRGGKEGSDSAGKRSRVGARRFVENGEGVNSVEGQDTPSGNEEGD